jgi:hypothetical protein
MKIDFGIDLGVDILAAHAASFSTVLLTFFIARQLE